jgi:hypothetical protein
MMTLTCVLVLNIITQTGHKQTAWHCDDIGYVVPQNSGQFYGLKENKKYNVLADDKLKFFFDVELKK